MKLRTRLLMFTAATALSVNMAYAAIDAEALAQSYITEGYTYVEVKVGPTQTKLEAVKGTRKVEVIYDNATNTVIKSEFEDAGDDYIGKTGIEIEDTDEDFEDGDDDEDDDEDDAEDDDEDDDEDEDDEEDDEEDDDEDDDAEDDDVNDSN